MIRKSIELLLLAMALIVWTSSVWGKGVEEPWSELKLVRSSYAPSTISKSSASIPTHIAVRVQKGAKRCPALFRFM